MDFQLIMSLGGRICLSDDSHGVAQVGLNYAKMRDYLQRKGVKSIWHLIAGVDTPFHAQQVGERTAVTTMPVDDWYEQPFW